MLTTQRIMTRLCTCAIARQPTAARQFAFTAPKMARFLRQPMNRKLDAKKLYEQQVQEGALLRPGRHFWRAFAFFAGTSLTAYTCASIVEYQNSRKKLRSLIEETVAMFREWYNQPTDTKSKFKQMDPVIATLVSINVAVFFLWRIGNQQLMLRYFANGIASKSLCTPMFLSVFSHSNLLHLLVNMYVLYNFAVPSIGFLGREQFMAFYLTSGVFSSLVSLAEKFAMRSAVPSLGASGAISAMIGYICMMVPDAKISIIFLPQWQFSAQNAIYGIIAFELACMLVGALTRVRIFDNTAHLGGIFFGIWYAKWGEELYRRKFMPTVVNRWISTGLMQSQAKVPVVFFDGQRHVRTTMDKLQSDFEAEEEEEKEQNELKRRWEEYQERKLQKQRQRKERILQSRLLAQVDEEDEGKKEEEE